jgi:hypothetical protein
MNTLIKALEEVIDRKADNHELKQELSTLTKMLKTGFDSPTTGMEKVPKLFASNDSAKISKAFDSIGNMIGALKISGNFDKFAEYMEIHFGIKFEFSSENAPNIRFNTKPKKFRKFEDAFTGYFLAEVPSSPQEAVAKILKSLDTLTKEWNGVNEEVKDALKGIIEAQTEHTPTVVKTVDKILTSARIKALSTEAMADQIDEILSAQQKGVELVRKETNVN